MYYKEFLKLILYEGIRYHNLKVTLHYIKFLNMTYHYNTLHSEMHLSTATIVLPLNGVHSNLLNSSSQALTRHFYCSIQNIKFLLGLV